MMKKIVFMWLLCAVVVMSAGALSVYASETDETNEEIIADDSVSEFDTADDMNLFGFYSDVQDTSFILTKIYNLLLTMFYFAIINVGRQIIVRNLRKGNTNGGFIR